jgi:hypothetical protein
MTLKKAKIEDNLIEVREGVFTFDIEALEKNSKTKKSVQDCCHSYRKGKRCKDCPLLRF